MVLPDSSTKELVIKQLTSNREIIMRPVLKQRKENCYFIP